MPASRDTFTAIRFRRARRCMNCASSWRSGRKQDRRRGPRGWFVCRRHRHVPQRLGVHRMPTLNQRTAHLNLWAAALGRDLFLRSITTDEISAVLDGWLDDGLDPETVRKRRTSLRSFFSTEDPRRLNPVKAAVNPKPEETRAPRDSLHQHRGRAARDAHLPGREEGPAARSRAWRRCERA